MILQAATGSNGTQIVLGSYVRDTGHGRRGRVKGLDYSFGLTSEAMNSSDGGRAWLAAQAIPVTDDERRGPWVSILVDHGGSILVPASRVEVIDPFPFDNPHATFYFGEGGDA